MCLSLKILCKRELKIQIEILMVLLKKQENAYTNVIEQQGARNIKQPNVLHVKLLARGNTKRGTLQIFYKFPKPLHRTCFETSRL